MSIVIGFLYVLEVIVAFLLGGIVMLQKPKDGGLNAAVGGGLATDMFGGQVGNVLTKTTVVLGVVFLLNTLALSRLTAHTGASVMEGVRTAAPVQQQAQPAPAPATPAAQAEQPVAPAPAAEPAATATAPLTTEAAPEAKSAEAPAETAPAAPAAK